MADTSVVEETLKRISSHKGIVGVVILNSEGIPIRTTLDNALSVQYAALVSHFVAKTRSMVKKLDHSQPPDDLVSIRLQSKKHEIVIAPEFSSGHEFILVVVQDPNVT